MSNMGRRSPTSGPVLAVLVLVFILGACSSNAPATAPPPAGTGSTEQTSQPQPPSGPKRMLATIRGTPANMSQTRTMRTVGNIPGLDGIEELVNAGLTHVDDHGVRLPQLAEAVPTVENGPGASSRTSAWRPPGRSSPPPRGRMARL
jgi:hypothetical protein